MDADTTQPMTFCFTSLNLSDLSLVFQKEKIVYSVPVNVEDVLSTGFER